MILFIMASLTIRMKCDFLNEYGIFFDSDFFPGKNTCRKRVLYEIVFTTLIGRFFRSIIP